ncbi:hypothetical protein [Anaerosphaera multitolerans]|uniref:Uncharacterized protein n=1 Tax=Anaerosphaera multitolerans TaxID=2487351 RepID=A0A437S6L4_9FIRM|nr:hypothetical protein [Anaerosphaera multitolerans]RVU54656.1 hypothetical protein EF514_06010 [Anaerosphaera multitolerans]
MVKIEKAGNIYKIVGEYGNSIKCNSLEEVSKKVNQMVKLIDAVLLNEPNNEILKSVKKEYERLINEE